MSAILTIAPRSSMKATESGISVFFIHMQCTAASSKMKSIPAFWAMLLRYMSPWARVPGSETTSARMRCMPALSWATGCWATGCWASTGPASRQATKKRVRTKYKRQGVSLPFGDSAAELLLHFVFFGALALLGAVALLRRLLRRLLGGLLGVLLVHLAGFRLVVLLLLRDRGHARG